MQTVAELRRKLGELTDKLNTEAVLASASVFEATEREIAETEALIIRAEAAQARSAGLARPAGDPAAAAAVAEIEGPEMAALYARGRPEARGLRGQRIGTDMAPDLGSQWRSYQARAAAASGFRFDASKHFRSFGEQLQAIAQYSLSRGAMHDNRLVRAPTGAGEVDPTGGGFLIQTDFSTAVFMLAHDMGEWLSRVNKIPISANANGLIINAVDETSRATGSRWGGVQSFWVAEGDTVTRTKPKFRRVEFNLHKLMSLMYITDELLQDSTALSAIAGQAFSEEIMFMTEDAIFEGQGSGQPMGIMYSPSRVTVPKQNGQASATLVKENVDNMWARMWARSRANAVWFINQDLEPQLNQMAQAVGTGGQLVYLPPGGLSGAPYASLYGRPLFATEYNNALGTEGDIMLADLSQYTLVDKGGVQAATSMHVAFLTDEMVFRITYRVDGKPMWTTVITPFKGSLTKSPFVTLAAR